MTYIDQLVPKDLAQHLKLFLRDFSMLDFDFLAENLISDFQKILNIFIQKVVYK